MITYEWHVAPNGLTVTEGVVTAVECFVYADNGAGKANHHPLPKVDLDSPGVDFTAFNSLTEEQVVGWVKAKLDVAAIEAEMAATIEAMPEYVAPAPPAPKLPWAHAKAGIDAAALSAANQTVTSDLNG